MSSIRPIKVLISKFYSAKSYLVKNLSLSFLWWNPSCLKAASSKDKTMSSKSFSFHTACFTRLAKVSIKGFDPGTYLIVCYSVNLALCVRGFLKIVRDLAFQTHFLTRLPA